jgi:hypothetical protein
MQRRRIEGKNIRGALTQFYPGGAEYLKPLLALFETSVVSWRVGDARREGKELKARGVYNVEKIALYNDGRRLITVPANGFRSCRNTLSH